MLSLLLVFSFTASAEPTFSIQVNPSDSSVANLINDTNSQTYTATINQIITSISNVTSALYKAFLDTFGTSHSSAGVEILVAGRTSSQNIYSQYDKVVFNTILDSRGGLTLNPSTGEIKVNSSGYYRVRTSLFFSGGSSPGGQTFLFVNNGLVRRITTVDTAYVLSTGSFELWLNSNDLISLRVDSSASQLYFDSNTGDVTVEKIQAPSATVNFRAVGVSSPSAFRSGANVIVYGSVEYDTESAYDNTNGKYTAKVPGKYLIGARLFGSIDTPQDVHALFILKNGSIAANDQQFVPFAGVNASSRVSTTVDLKVGDTIEIASGTGGNVYSITSDASLCSVTIDRVGD